MLSAFSLCHKECFPGKSVKKEENGRKFCKKFFVVWVRFVGEKPSYRVKQPKVR